ncbi:MAG TPA: serine/threonine-protein kinase, partial [Thermoanaerobaculia bacterium]|nr:serine/threonine-protein kinase [Thermoanaerobaculia bacterium]
MRRAWAAPPVALETASMTPAVESFDAGDRLSPGQLLCGRFLILRRLGRGGMSEVYECTDLELGIAVAAKVLRSSLARRPEARDLLRRELLFARRITHPNVCRLFELFVDEGATGNVVNVMELLEGVTLSQRLRGGPLPGADEALRILTGIAAGLAAVHAAGVVHRDLKSSNVQLVDSPTGARPVLTDFGIAKEALDDGTEAPRPPGTLPYMAPEVRRGAPATTAADVFAFGVLALEVLTGERASRPSGEAPDGSAAAARLRARGVGVGWRRLIRRCLAIYPADRPLDGTVLLRAVERLGRRWSWRHAAAVAAAVTALAALALPRFLAPGADSRQEAPPPFTAVVAGERVSMVFGSLRASGAAAGPLAASLSQLLEGNLAAGDRALVRSSQKLRKVIDLESSDRSLPSLRRIAKALDGDFLVLGDVRREAGRDVEVELRLIPADERAPVRTVRRSGDLEELFDLAAGLAADLRRVAGIQPVTAAELAPVVAMQPRSPQAQMLYGQGMEHMLHGDLRSARLAFEGAVKIDDRFALARAGLADVLLRQGKRAAAAKAASEALGLASRIPRVQQLGIEAVLAA